MRPCPPVDWRTRPLLPAAATARLDAAAVAAGVPGHMLMENAGRAVARAITSRFAPQPVAVLCGPGNNGGDGYVIARRLAAAGWPVRVVAASDPARLTGDATHAFALWRGPVERAGASWNGAERLVVDALFGVGLARPIEGALAGIVDSLITAGPEVVAVDIPSGIAADTGEVLGTAVKAVLTVTFCTAKPGHVLLPGRLYRGELTVADIGIGAGLIDAERGDTHVNAPARWADRLPRRTAASHKYDLGHAIVVGGPAHATGAARLAAVSALRAGAGLVTVAAPAQALPVYACHLTSVMTRPLGTAAALRTLVGDPRITAVLIGPGCGTGEPTLRRVRALLESGRPLVLDADALTALGPELRGGRRLPPGCVLTPHDGEFRRIHDTTGDRLARARACAAASGAVVVLKGADTVIAEPCGRALIQADAPPELATAGTGDVLAGAIAGLLAQAMPPFHAAAAGVWIHAEAARLLTRAFIAEDLPGAIPEALARARS